MKKTLLLASLACLFSFKVNASEIKPYVGFDISSAVVGLETGLNSIIEDSYNTFSINAGAKINELFAIEAFYQSSSDEDTKRGVGSTSFKSGGVDGLLFIPASEISNFIVSLGIGNYDVMLDGISGELEEDSLANRYGFGGEFTFSENVSGRVMVRYVSISEMESVNDITEVSFGVRYSF